MAKYEIYVRDPAGNLQTVIQSFTKLEYARKENEIGVLYLTLPRGDYEKYFRKDARLEVWRTIGGKTYLDAYGVWFLRRWVLTSNGAAQEWQLTAFDANYLIESRIIADYAETARAYKTMAIDGMMTEIMRETLGTGSGGGTRDISAYLSIAATNPALAPSTSKKFAWRNVLKVLQELAEESYQRGTYLVFDVQYDTATMLAFRTFVTALGINRGRTSGNPVVVNETRGSLVNAVLDYDYTQEITRVVVGGTGTESNRSTYRITDLVRVTESPFSRRELFVNATQSGSTAAALESEGQSALNEGRPRTILTGSIQDTSGLIYGIDYNYGDIVVAEHEGYSFDAHIDRIHVTVTRDSERLDNRVRGVL